jgi:hypothetical protein
MNVWIRLFYIMLFFVGFFAIHEFTHAVVFEEYGCGYHFGLTWGYVYTEGECVGVGYDRAGLMMAQAGVESLGYQLCIPLLVLLLILFEVTERNEHL